MQSVKLCCVIIDLILPSKLWRMLSIIFLVLVIISPNWMCIGWCCSFDALNASACVHTLNEKRCIKYWQLVVTWCTFLDSDFTHKLIWIISQRNIIIFMFVSYDLKCLHCTGISMHFKLMHERMFLWKCRRDLIRLNGNIRHLWINE